MIFRCPSMGKPLSHLGSPGPKPSKKHLFSLATQHFKVPCPAGCFVQGSLVSIKGVPLASCSLEPCYPLPLQPIFGIRARTILILMLIPLPTLMLIIGECDPGVAPGLVDNHCTLGCQRILQRPITRDLLKSQFCNFCGNCEKQWFLWSLLKVVFSTILHGAAQRK